MTEKFKHTRNKDEMRIDVKESFDLNFWCDELNLRAEELKDIVRMVGPSVHDIRLHLAKKQLVNWTEIN